MSKRQSEARSTAAATAGSAMRLLETEPIDHRGGAGGPDRTRWIAPWDQSCGGGGQVSVNRG